MSQQHTSTVVVGGGVIGLSAAYHLARKKAGRVILLEKGRIGDGFGRQDLQRDNSIQSYMPGPIDHSHTTLSNQCQDL